MADLIVASRSLVAEASRWSDLPPDELHRRAAGACHSRDAAELQSLMQAFLVMRGKSGASVSPSTIRAYRLAVRQLLDGFGDQSLISPSRDAGFRWVRSLEARGLKPASVTQRLAGARTLYAALRWSGATSADPFKDVKPARDPTPAYEKRNPYPEADIVRLMEIATTHDRLLVLLMGHAGLRVSEAINLRFGDIDLSAGTLTVLKGKGGKRRRVGLSRTLREELYAQWKSEGRVFPYRSPEQARRRVKRLCEKAVVPYLGAHAFRHATGTRVLASGGQLIDAARMLGHASTSTAEIYAKWNDRKLTNLLQDW